MAVTFDAVSRPTPWAESYSWTHSFVDADLIVVVVTQAYGSSPSGVTCDGVALTSFLTMGSVGVGYQTFYFYLPGSWSGDKTITVNPGDYNTVYAISFKGTDPVEPLVEEFALEISSMSARAVSGASENDMYLDCVYSYWDAGGYTPGASQTQRSEWVDNTYISGLSTAPGSATSLIETPDTPSSYDFTWYCAVVKASSSVSLTISDATSGNAVDNVYLEGIFPEDCLSASYVDTVWHFILESAEPLSATTADEPVLIQHIALADARSLPVADNVTLLLYGPPATCTMELPSLEADGEAFISIQIDGDMHLPLLETAGTHYHSAFCTGDMDIPLVTFSTSLLVGTVSTGSVTFPLMSITAETAISYTGSITIPSYTVDATGIVGIGMTGDMAFPSLTISALAGLVMEGEMTLPDLTVSGTGWSQTITGSVTLPLLEVLGYKAWVSAATDTRTIVMNMNNMAVSTYETFNFNSYATFQGKHYGANEDGVYLLEGDTYAGTSIAWEIKLGIHDFLIRALKRIPDVYLAMKGVGTLQVYVTSDRAVESVYNLAMVTSRTKNNKVQIGKGHKGRYWEFRFTGETGMDFQLEEIVMNVDVLSRKV